MDDALLLGAFLNIFPHIFNFRGRDFFGKTSWSSALAGQLRTNRRLGGDWYKRTMQSKRPSQYEPHQPQSGRLSSCQFSLCLSRTLQHTAHSSSLFIIAPRSIQTSVADQATLLYAADACRQILGCRGMPHACAPF